MISMYSRWARVPLHSALVVLLLWTSPLQEDLSGIPISCLLCFLDIVQWWSPLLFFYFANPKLAIMYAGFWVTSSWVVTTPSLILVI